LALKKVVAKLVHRCQQPDHIADSRLMPEVVRPDSDLYLLGHCWLYSQQLCVTSYA